MRGKALFGPSSPPFERSKNTIFSIFCSLDFFGLVEEFKNWKMMRADKVMQLLCLLWHCNSEWPLCRYAIHRNHGVVACAGTQQQHLSGRCYLHVDGPFESKNYNFDPVSNSKDRYEVKLNVETVPV
jgi:hypothetical protein